MSLSSFLLDAKTKEKEKGKAIDKGLDDLFRANQAAVASTSASAGASSAHKPSSGVEKEKVKDKKRKQPGDEPRTSKKLRVALVKESKDDKPENRAKKHKHASPTRSPTQAAPAKHKRKLTDPSGSEESENEDAEPEASSSAQPISLSHDAHADESGAESDSDNEGDPSKLVHESVANEGNSKHRSGSKTKYVPENETAEKRNERTVFVGNVPVDIVKNRSLQKQFKRHMLSFVPAAKIESVRFRSVAFNKPTAQLPSEATPAKDKDGRQHDRDRAASWRASKGEDEDAGNPSKVFLTPAEKKRVAFIKHEFHDSADSVNAYVVFAHPAPPPAAEKARNVPLPRPVMDPYEAARTAAKEADASVFMERTLRVDAVGGGGRAEANADMKGDPKATVFVGNLDFVSKEEDLRAFFEALMVAEKGKPGQSSTKDDDDDDDEEDEEDEQEGGTSKGKAKETRKPSSWVKRVRIIRDKDTLLGKGFAYVQFTARECVDEVLTFEPERLKFAKRKLRVQRCKTLPGASKASSIKQSSRGKLSQGPSANTASARRPSSAPVVVPKGNPALGEQLAGLSKEERKVAKASDADRVARRLAKKRAKALAEKGVKSKADKAGDVLRVRKRAGNGDKGYKASEKKKGRVRSGRALSKMNTKK